MALVVAFFIGGSFVSLALVELIPVVPSAKDVNQQARMIAYLIIILYPLEGGFAVNITNKWFKKR